jgi:NAD(P)-dependent dehydrogenase (short-subunit alcohol dehydrogenase family)
MQPASAPIDQPCLQGRVMVVTGGAGAIGREIAALAAQHGASVLVNDIGGAVDGSGGDHAPAQQVAEAIRAMSGMTKRPMIAAAGGVNETNARAYAEAGADLLVTSAPYSAPPADISVRMSLA